VEKDGGMVFLDCGIMGELSVEDRHAVIRFVLSIPEKNPEKSLQCILSLARDVTSADVVSFKEEALPILQETYSNTIGQKSVGKAVYQIISKGARYGVHFDQSHVLMAKAIYQAEGLGLRLNPNFKVSEGLNVFTEKYLKKQYRPIALVKRTAKVLLNHKDLLLELPDHINSFLEGIEESKAKNNSQQEMEKQLLHVEQQLEQSNRLVYMGVMAIMLVAMAFLLLYFEGSQKLFGVPLSLYVFGISLCFILYLLFTHKRIPGEEHHLR
jgi:ubiquinone biosynthesis protein